MGNAASLKIAVLGAGAWGTALAIQAASRHRVMLWARDAELVQSMVQGRVNASYLPGCVLPNALQLDARPLGPWLRDFDLIVLATPVSALREMLTRLAPHLQIEEGDHSVPVVWLCKGFEAEQHARPGLLPHEVQQQVAPYLRSGVLSGPSFAQEVAAHQPTALVAASKDARVSALLVQAFHCEHLRVYASDDLIGVEVAGAVKNVLAIATGLCDGLGLGLNARAALITRGLSEMTGLAVSLGGRAQTCMGLSGLGDLVLTATGDLSRNRRVGMSLAKGLTLGETLDSLGHVAEGVYCAKTVVQRAQLLHVEMPIANAVVALLGGRMTPKEAVVSLMGRSAKPESTTMSVADHQ
jgi:glycerol-3-phosphate dehydrogenase (NAD(P)+)